MKKIPKTHNIEDVPKISTYRTSWKAKFLEAMKENGELLGKIERLTEVISEFRQEVITLNIEKLELQKQVDELKAKNERLKIDLENEKNWGKIQMKQAVKDTAKEILYDIKYGFVFSYNAKNESYQDGYDQALEDYDNNLEKYFKERYGVEVE